MNIIEAVNILTNKTKLRRKNWLLLGCDYENCYIWLDNFKGLIKYESLEELRKEDILADDWEVVE